MRRLCRHCSSKKNTSISNSKNHSLQTPDKHIHTEYGLAKVVSPEKMIYEGGDDYMIARFQRTQSKVKKLQRELKKVKKRLEDCQYGVKTVLNRDSQPRDSSVESVKIYQSKGSKARSSNTEESGSRNVSDTSSKKRQIGRFTKYSDNLLPASAEKQDPSQNFTPKRKTDQETEIAKAHSITSEKSAEYDADEMGQYLPAGNGINTSIYFNQGQEQKQERLNRRFQDLILIEKLAPEEERRQIRKQIKAISKMLADDSQY